MPRPGPRPYECVRRAWHSDKHQPMRGSLIQEIFRVVDEIHSSATKKNREWQEKLPVVVLKAEKIMYSKANSEAEYMDLKTLFDRTNDAINTIIRRDETTETGELLQPCIEAALNLGCTSITAPRSQRHNNPRCYLNPSPSSQEPTSIPPTISDNISHKSSPHLLPLQSANRATNPQYMLSYSTFTRPTTMNSTRVGSGSCSRAASQEFKPISPNDFPPSNLGCTYPLYYGSQFQSKETQTHLSFHNTQMSNPNTVFVGTPLRPTTEMGILRNLFSNERASNASNSATLADYRDPTDNPPAETECDLSLRLGLFLAPSTSSERSERRWVHEVEDVGSSSSQEGNKFFDQSARKDKGVCLFPRDNADDPLESCSSKWNSEGEGATMVGTIKKRKEHPTHSSQDGVFCWQPKLSSNHFLGRMKKPGL